MQPFLVCIHDATPAYANETRAMIRDLAPLIGRRMSLAVVPDWHGAWPLAAHREYCALLNDASEELLLHGYFHNRKRGRGAASLLARNCDEMNGLDADETKRTLERGQSVFSEVFGSPARGFLAPGWQRGHVGASVLRACGLDHVLGFFALDSSNGGRIPLATWTWDCGRWAWLGHVGHGTGWALHSMERGVPTLAIHPADLDRSFWPKILELIRDLLEKGYEPSTVAGLLAAKC